MKSQKLHASFWIRHESAVKAQLSAIQRHYGVKLNEILKFRQKKCSGIQFEVLLSENKNFKT